ncbi:DUF2017 domain-containing protein [Glycomyces sp. TRM65418]|uniref:DUF2017 domain-containing protein n=1 Tax=Glycomyces sp. TRM65418 TaxID=2867006 RepID=UPI001CE4D5D9|nr:DUF2017 domain-containing protein [Glycomyces sp. TRM65418]MCC3763461.1 DUF2017 domain-containing protein [Glycomyces sp. TRM65418]QZD57450.1 DUF2017 domain-containing protein [Glycomyces sp. TRM65418]
MAGYFKPLRGGGAAVDFDDVEIAVLRDYAEQLVELIGPCGALGGDAEELIESAFDAGPSEPPADPVLARLFPDAYTDPDGPADEIDARAASAEFRRFTENDLRARKREDALAVIRSLDALDPVGDRRVMLHLKPDECRHWLGTLNDLRLAIATRLEITDDEVYEELRELPDADVRKPLAMVYDWLTGLQDTLVEAMTR